ncbi:hypothetical protein [Tellurirhabdus bombi]|uniref:hypothetical protein n=1 Tax=Tellurirhabdus bombi TaxID=2907205 RepID=UPI001F1E5253|nr:hypothetical protein [Tellurirhabdus bombi]
MKGLQVYFLGFAIGVNMLMAGHLSAQHTELVPSDSASMPEENFTHELRFAQYLTDKDAFEEAIFVLSNLNSLTLTVPQRDSLRYSLGWNAYSAKQLGLASRSLLTVSSQSPYYLKSQFFGNYSRAFQGQTDSAYAALNQLTVPDATLNELKAVELAGISLLKRDYDAFNQHRQGFTYASYALSTEEKRMDDYAHKLQSFKRKSPVLAGLYSAVVPGLGKIYAGKKRQGIASLLPILSMGLLTYEGLRKDGVKSARFISFGTLFTVFYVGNIWGSVLSVKIKRNEFNREYDNKILFDMHIPMRNLFQ